ncbi:MAG: peptide ABC transporter ATP-binding protein [Actinobacteria bacterium HGW-Actinobacteria-7]|nr:MAG: peptide ABC transporter ATP-binding protein [Actinobacteria bacterium HGW-Actinobacteria-7]
MTDHTTPDQSTAPVRACGETLLDVRNLSTDFTMKKGTVNAVIDVSFSVCEGEVLAIVGESGSGKSVTSLSVMGLLQEPGHVVGGEVVFRDRNLLALSEAEMRSVRGDQISMIFQEPMTSLNPVFTIENQLTESIRTHMKLDRAAARVRAIEMLRLVGIPSPEKRLRDYPHQMSGGMRQRVMIAMALSCDPQLLIADEPTTALDVTIQAQILALISDLRDKIGMAVLLITHDLGVVAETADRVVVMYAGRIVERATAEQLFDRPMHPYTLGLLESIPTMEDTDSDESLYMIPGMVPNPLNMPKGCAFADRCEKRMERCFASVPDLYEADGRRVRCFLYDATEAGVSS